MSVRAGNRPRPAQTACGDGPPAISLTPLAPISFGIPPLRLTSLVTVLILPRLLIRMTTRRVYSAIPANGQTFDSVSPRT